MKKQLTAAQAHLLQVDATLAGIIASLGPCTLHRDSKPLFHTLVWAIVNQQISVKAAQAVERRLLAWLDCEVIVPEHLFGVRRQSLQNCGLSGAKARYIQEIARRVRSGRLDLDDLQPLDDDSVAQRLMELPGIGRWSADMVLMFSMGRLDVLPLGDYALRKSLRIHYGLAEDADYETYLALAEPWRPYRTVASWYYWAAVD